MITNLNLKKPTMSITESITTGEYCKKIMNYAKKTQNLIEIESKICKE
jgi:hypothetical protein